MNVKVERKVLGVTGIRAEYDIMSSVFKAIDDHSQLQLSLLVTGSHLSKSRGHTVDAIYADGFSIEDEVESLINGDDLSSRIKGLSVQLAGFVQTVRRVAPDFLLVLGDREEAMSTALLGAYMKIPVAHVCGGDVVAAHIDDAVRHAVTKLSHLHLVTNKESYDRVVKMGEREFRVKNVGHPGIDRLRTIPDLSLPEVGRRIGVEFSEGEPFILLIQHPDFTAHTLAYAQMKETIDAVEKLGVKAIATYPNTDPGSEDLIQAMRDCQNLHLFHNIPRLEFINLMRHASCMLGNSSAGVLETPYLKLPSISVGNRQKGRLCAENVEFVAHDANAIVQALQKALYDKNYLKIVEHCANPYGDGFASNKIADVLASVEIDNKLICKDMAY